MPLNAEDYEPVPDQESWWRRKDNPRKIIVGRTAASPRGAQSLEELIEEINAAEMAGEL